MKISKKFSSHVLYPITREKRKELMMRVSSINAYAPSFGQVRRSAAERAIKDAKGDITKLNLLRDLIEEQRDNHSYDVVKGRYTGIHRYQVVKNCFNSSVSYHDDIESACQEATKLLKDDEKRMLEQERINENKERFNKLAKEILDSCEN